MERGKLAQWLFIGLAIFLAWQFLGPGGGLFGSKGTELQPAPAAATSPQGTPEAPRPAEDLTCVIEQQDFDAVLTTQGAALRNLKLKGKKYTTEAKGATPIDLVAPADVENTRPLRTDLRLPAGDAQQVPHNNLDWKLAAHDASSCTFTYEDATAKLVKIVRATGKPYELETTVTVQNLAPEARKHRLTVEQDSWRTKAETEGSLGRISEHMTEVVAATAEKTERLAPDAFDPSDFKDAEFTNEAWRRSPGAARWVAVGSVYFAKIAIPFEGPAPFAESRIEEHWDRSRTSAENRTKDAYFGHVYRARLAYPEVELAPQAQQTYKVLSYLGPKDRDLLAGVGHGVTEVINLGTFSPIAKVLVAYLRKLHALTGSWGWAIVLLTITVRTLLFPLSISQIKSSAAMRRLKPEMDELNARYKDDPAQRGLALQELWRKHGVTNPVLGCIPVLLQMPIWFALYQALQTAVELYHVPFGPFIPDLSAEGKYFIIPLVLGASSFFQQKLMPPQGDPMQQKMMQYMLPGIFLVMMLFLPAGLGVYMLTNTWLGIAQQVGVERYLRNKTQGTTAGIEVREKPSAGDKTPGGDPNKSPPALGKGKARVRG
jgi:YidC/Oxa1 family membrane protein insertase